MVSILCEKPSAARNFAVALGGMSGNFEGTDYKIVNARGHLYEWDDPENQVEKSLMEYIKSWDIKNLPWNELVFKWKRKRKDGVSSELSNIKAVCSSADEICLSCDVDPYGEGFLLSYEIIDELGFTSSAKKFSRMFFIDESAPEIQKAFRNRKVIPNPAQHYEQLMAECRTKWDYLSMQWTRMATIIAGQGNIILREGRLKSAMKVLVGDQIEAYNNYKKVPFYQNRFKDENGNIYTNPEEPVFPDKDQVPSTYHSSDVVHAGTTRKQTPPKKLLDMATLNGILAPKGYSGKQILSVYQKMYEAGILSYPRTEDKFISPEQFNEMLPLVDKIAGVVGVDISLLTHRTPRSTHVKTGGAHGANRPGKTVPVSLSDIETTYGKLGADIYDLLARSFLAMLAEDYVYDSIKGYVKDYPKFVTTISVPVSSGWKAVFKETDDDEATSKGLGKIADPFIYEGFPPRPARPTVKFLMKELEKRDIGTGATRTSTLSEICTASDKWQVFTEKKGVLDFADPGRISYVLLKNTHIGNLDLTKDIQTKIKEVGAGKLNMAAVLAEIAPLVIDDLKIMKENAAGLASLGLKIPVRKEKVTGIFEGKEVEVSREWGGYCFSDQEMDELFSGNMLDIYGLTSKSGSKYNVRGKFENLTYNKKKYVGFNIVNYIDDNGNPIIQNKDTENYVYGKWKGKDIRFKKVWSGREFTPDEQKALLSGKTIEFDMPSAKGGMRHIKGKLKNLTYQGRKYVGFSI